MRYMIASLLSRSHGPPWGRILQQGSHAGAWEPVKKQGLHYAAPVFLLDSYEFILDFAVVLFNLDSAV